VAWGSVRVRVREFVCVCVCVCVAAVRVCQHMKEDAEVRSRTSTVHVRARCMSLILCCAQCLKHIGVSMLVYSRATRESEACSTFVCSRSTSDKHFCASSTSYPWKPVYFFPRLSAPKHVGGQPTICHRWAMPASMMAHTNASINTGVRVHLPR